MKIIFLDVDGVLNSTRSMIAWHREYFSSLQLARPPLDTKNHCARNHIDPIAVKLLNRVTEGSGAKYVISSTHRKHIPDPLGNGRDMIELQKYFAMFGLTGEVVGYTPVDSKGHRGREIDQWLQDNNHWAKVKNFAIIDDDSDMLETQKPFFVQTSQEDGFLYKHFKLLCSILDYKDKP